MLKFVSDRIARLITKFYDIVHGTCGSFVVLCLRGDHETSLTIFLHHRTLLFYGIEYIIDNHEYSLAAPYHIRASSAIISCFNEGRPYSRNQLVKKYRKKFVDDCYFRMMYDYFEDREYSEYDTDDR